MACASSGCSLAWVAGKSERGVDRTIDLVDDRFWCAPPSSAMVGTSGRSASRFDDGVPSGRNFLSRNCGNRTSPAQINNKCDQAQHPPTAILSAVLKSVEKSSIGNILAGKTR